MKSIIIGLNWLGDIIMSLPAIIAASNHSEIHIVTRPHLAEVYRLFSTNLVIHPIATHNHIWSFLPELKPLRKLQADHAIVLPDSFRAAIIAKLCASQVITGFNTQWRSMLLHQKIDKPENFKQMHESDLHFLLVKAAGLADNISELPRPLFSDEVISSLARKTNLPAGQEYFVLAPGAAFGSAKRWPPTKFSELADLMHKHYSLPVIITGSNSEKPLAAEISSATSARIIDLSGQTTLTELALLLSRARAMVANDSGTMHLGALNSTPTVIPVGPTDMNRTGPLNKRCRTVIAKNCPQAPCRQKTCPRHDHICMQSIAATTVFAELIKLDQEHYE